MSDDEMEEEKVKRQKGSLLQRAIAMMLSAVLVIGMTANAVPMHVFAQENVEGQQETTDVDETEEQTEPADGDETGNQTETPDGDVTGSQTQNTDGDVTGEQTETPDGNETGESIEPPEEDIVETPGNNLPGGELADSLPEEEEKNPSGSTDASEEEAAVSITFQVYGYDVDAFGTLELMNEDGTMSCTTEIEDRDGYTEITLSGTVDEFLTQEEDSRWSTRVYVYRNQEQIADYTVYKGEDQTFERRSFYAVTFINDGEKYWVDYALDGEAELIKPADPTREGYQFAGWMTEEGGEEAFDFTQRIASPETVYAGWAAQAVMMSARVDTNRASVNVDNSVKGWILLNGTPVVVTAGADANKTKLYYDANLNGEVDAGENPIELANEEGSLDEGYNLSQSEIYGEAGTGDVKITMTGGNVKLVQAAFVNSLHGNFDFHMTGGTVGEVRSSGYSDMTGNVNIVFGGNAKVSGAVYGGGQNSDIKIDGNINIIVEENAVIGSGGNYDGIFIGGQQDDNVITGTAAVTIKGGFINGNVYGDLLKTIFQQKVTIDVQGGNISGFVQGLTVADSQAPAVEIRAAGGTIQGSVIGANNAYVEDVQIIVNGGTIEKQLIGAFANRAGRVSIDIQSGSVGTLIMGKADKEASGNNSWTKGTISIHGGTINCAVWLRNVDVAAAAEASEIRLEGSPVFGTDGSIILQSGEAVTQTGEVTGSDIKIDVTSVNQEGTLIVRPANDSITLNPAVFTLSGTTYDLIFGTEANTSRNLYLGNKAAAHQHQWEDTWTDNDTHHWHNCSAADCPITDIADKNGYAAHTEDAGTVTIPPTQMTEGERTYKCSICGRVMRTETISKLSPDHEHEYGNDWKSDETNHWHECRECGEKQDIARHTEDAGTVTTPPTQNTDGVRTYKCSGCGRFLRTETIPATGSGGSQEGDSGENNGSGSGGSGSSGSGSNSPEASDNVGSGGSISAGDNTNSNAGDSAGGSSSSNTVASAETRVKSENQGFLRKEVHVKAEDTFDTIIATPLAELSDILLTDTEKQLVGGGVDIRLVLDVKDAADSVSSEDKSVVERTLSKSLPSFSLGQYLDISLYKLVGTQRTDIARTSDKIIVTIAVPERLRNTDDSKTRVFAIIRVHDGKAEILDDLDTGADTISIATDCFSTYAIIYKDVAKTGGTAVVSTAAGKTSQTRDNEPKTQDNTPIELCATLAMISGLTYLMLYFTDRKHGMSEETKKELVSRMIGWAKRGGRIRRWIALIAIFALLVYYHSIGKQTAVEWKEVYEE